MDSREFFKTIAQLGEFHCVRDLRRFNNQKRENPKYSLAQYLGHFGYCRDGQYHHCEFHLNTDSVKQIQVVGYQKNGERDGQVVRIRSNTFTYWGRGRRWNAQKKKS